MLNAQQKNIYIIFFKELFIPKVKKKNAIFRLKVISNVGDPAPL